jgi:glycosyltransferase involved in cell wall biosynthesis
LLIYNFGRAVSSQRRDFDVRVYALEQDSGRLAGPRGDFGLGSGNFGVIPVPALEPEAPSPALHIYDYPRILVSGFLGARMFGSLDWSSFVNGTLILTRVGLNPINKTVLLRLLSKLGREYDIVHVGAWSTAYAAAIAMGRRSKREWATDGAKYVCHALYHAPVGYSAVPPGTIGRMISPELRVRMLGCLDRYLAKNILRSYDAITVSTPYELTELGRWGLNNVTLIGEGVDLDYVESIRSEALERARARRSDLGVDHVALFIGAKAVAKGYSHLLQATERLHQQGEELCLVSVGKYPWYYPDEDRSTMRLENRLVAEGIVISYDSVSELDKYALIEASDLVVIPSLLETIPLVFLEAWAMMKPVIGASIPSLHSVITADGEGGILVPFGDIELIAQAMLRLFNDTEYARRVGSTGFEKVRTVMNLKEVGRRLVELYSRLA